MTMPDRVSIRTLARDLGLSTATVSEALRESSTVRPASKKSRAARLRKGSPE